MQEGGGAAAGEDVLSHVETETMNPCSGLV